jgi:hypothetical protein
MPCDETTEYWDGQKCCPKFNELLGTLNTNLVAKRITETDPEKIREVTKFILNTIKNFQKDFPAGKVVKRLDCEH